MSEEQRQNRKGRPKGGPSMSERRKSRIAALEILYQREVTGYTIEKIIDEHLYSPRNDPLDSFSTRILHGVAEHDEEIDAAIEGHANKWLVSRMPLMDLNAMRLAVYELLYADDIPANVSINEAVELAKIFGGPDSAKFVNGVLGKIAAELRPDG